jgi:hypothetical protein
VEDGWNEHSLVARMGNPAASLSGKTTAMINSRALGGGSYPNVGRGKDNRLKNVRNSRVEKPIVFLKEEPRKRNSF